MKLQAALCMAWCFLGSMQFARSGVLRNLGLEEAIREEVGAILEDTFRGGETFGVYAYNAAEDAEAGRPAEKIALVNYFLKKVIKEKAARQNILREMSSVDAGSDTAEQTAKHMAHAGIVGINADTPTHIKQLVGIMEKRIPNELMRNKLYNSLATIKLGDVKANEVGPVAYMLDSMSK